MQTLPRVVKRQFWIDLLERQWARRSIVWLRGVRRVGKTFLARSLDRIEYFDCELPRVRRAMEDPEGFLAGLRGERIVFDEVHPRFQRECGGHTIEFVSLNEAASTVVSGE